MADEQALTIVKSEPLPELKIVKSEPDQPFIPNPKEFMNRVGDAMVNVPVGMVKQIGRYVQAVPGVAAATDKLYGLPEGASKAAMQPSNPTQKAGGYVADAALVAATAGAEAGAPLLTRTAGYVSNPTVLQKASAAVEPASSFAGDVVDALKYRLTSGGPITADKVAGLITKYGKDAVKAAMLGTVGYGSYRAFQHLF